MEFLYGVGTDRELTLYFPLLEEMIATSLEKGRGVHYNLVRPISSKSKTGGTQRPGAYLKVKMGPPHYTISFHGEPETETQKQYARQNTLSERRNRGNNSGAREGCGGETDWGEK